MTSEGAERLRFCLFIMHFSILSDAFNMNNNSRNKKIIFIIDNGRKTIEKDGNLLDYANLEKLNNIYNYSFYMVNNYIPNFFFQILIFLN